MDILRKALFIRQLVDFDIPNRFKYCPIYTPKVLEKRIAVAKKVYESLENESVVDLLTMILHEVEVFLQERCAELERERSVILGENGILKKRVRQIGEELHMLRAEVACAIEHIDEIQKDLENLIEDKEKLAASLAILRDLLSCALREPEKPARHHYNIEIIKMCVLMVVNAGCSLRSCVDVLKIFKKYLPHIIGEKVPAYTTVRDWVMMGGLILSEVLSKRITGKYIFIVDESIVLNKQKMLVILAAPLSPVGNKPLSFRDVAIIIMEAGEEWKKKAIMDKLREAAKIMGRKPQYVLSDEGGNIISAVKGLRWKQHRDIGHCLANVLKAVYKNDERFKEFLKDLGALKNLTLSASAAFAPPKQRSKVRFMNIAKSIKWAAWIISAYPQLDEISQKRFKQICTKHRGIVAELEIVTKVLDEILKFMKSQGLSHETVKRASDLLNGMPGHFPGTLKVRDGALAYLEREGKLLKRPSDCHSISSDIIESFFSDVKRRLPNAKYFGYTEYCLSMYVRLYVENPDDFDSIDMVESYGANKLKAIQEWRETNTVENAYRKRMEFKKNMAKNSKSA